MSNQRKTFRKVVNPYRRWSNKNDNYDFADFLREKGLINKKQKSLLDRWK